MAIQGDILDAVAPGLLTLATVLLVYKYLRSGHSMMKATFWILGIGLVLGAVGIIGDEMCIRDRYNKCPADRAQTPRRSEANRQ